MQDLIFELVLRACREQVVLHHALENGMELLTCPHEQTALIAVGYPRERAHQASAETVLRKRAVQLPLLGAWLPAVLPDGGWYLVRRLPSPERTFIPVEQELTAVQELLA
ncbi:hypothetical protein [Janthinobacterium agaricidamnosum]|uniref:Uncharacterized protein n=1 Tax=Janthinobacterium agaricidamnosum NBRC 102515 = DSM 9628 TaxID=1349767 RepID=W0V345_9BURK|nr:hypothetical protein [Janthinobacterium agaricidamnosum]CDG82296.1 hypothetical protein GJA_1658 [Janthinobacterium agaricidamnosum NBRC 102515 = DSM 9628]